MEERHLAHIGDLLNRFCCESAKVLEVVATVGTAID
jgi:hypothetical protein